MKSLLIITTFLVSIAQQKCGKSSAAEIPSCIQAKIDSIRTQPRWNPPASVEEYLYKGRRVFLFSSPCCDQYNEAIDADCNSVCAPSGGFTGRGDNKCPDFKDSAQFVKLVWKDERQ